MFGTYQPIVSTLPLMRNYHAKDLFNERSEAFITRLTEFRVVCFFVCFFGCLSAQRIAGDRVVDSSPNLGVLCIEFSQLSSVPVWIGPQEREQEAKNGQLPVHVHG